MRSFFTAELSDVEKSCQLKEMRKNIMYLQFQFEHQVDKKAFFTILEDSHFLQSVKMDVDGNLSLLRNIAQPPQKMEMKRPHLKFIRQHF